MAGEGLIESGLVGWSLYPAIILAGLCFGLGPALLAVALCALGVWYLGVRPSGEAAGVNEAATLVLFLAVGGVLAGIAAAYRAAVSRQQAALRQANAAAEGLERERQHAAEITRALRESEERFRMMAEAVPGVLFTARPDGERDYISPAFYEYTGMPAGSAEGWGWIQALHPADRAGVLARWNEALRTGEFFRSEHRYRSATGEYRWFMSRAIPERDWDRRIVRWFGTVTDIHDLHAAREELWRHRDHLEELVRERTAALESSQEQLRLSERLAALGTLAAGMGHDLGNLLLPIRARLDVLRMRDLPPEAQADVDAVEQCAEYLQSLARGLRLFARDPRSGGGPDAATDLRVWQADVAPFFQNLLTRNITLDWDLQPGLPAVGLAPHQLTQAVVNLVNNARDAIGPEVAGRITVRATRTAQDPAVVRLSVIDTGPGMSEEVRRHAMEPFFTTKVRGVATGTGLGLALVHGTVEAAGGSVQIQSSPGGGTAATLTLPAANAEPEEPNGPAPAACVTIEDARVRALVSSILRSTGFEIRDGPPNRGDAVELWVTSPAPELLEVARRQHEPRRTVLLGDDPEWRHLGAVVLREQPSPTDLRAAVEEAFTGGAGVVAPRA